MTPIKVCFWTSAFQADTQSLAYALAARDDFEVVVAMDRPDLYRREAVWRLRPFGGRLVARGRPWTFLMLKHFAPDILIVDNHVPSYRLAPRVLVLWHGFGWRNDDISDMRRKLRKHVGDVTRPSPKFIWQAFGDWDRQYTIEHRAIHPDNVRALGSAYSDDLLPGSAVHGAFRLDMVADAYQIDVVNQPTVLMGLTWHHRGAMGNWGDESELLGRLFAHLRERGANVLMRMHDRRRYPPEYLARLQAAVGGHNHVQLKFKDQACDSWADFMVSRVLVTNYSSLANPFYYTGKPTVHIDPSGTPDDYVYRRATVGKVVEEQRQPSSGIWKLSPEEHGGLRARSFAELIEHVDCALDKPACCQIKAGDFVNRYITSADGHTCERIARVLRDWIRAP
jgi:hypothetical protein